MDHKSGVLVIGYNIIVVVLAICITYSVYYDALMIYFPR